MNLTKQELLLAILSGAASNSGMSFKASESTSRETLESILETVDTLWFLITDSYPEYTIGE